MSALLVENLHKRFGDLEVLRGIDLEVAEHEVVCLIGASGSGKSTLLRCVNLIERVDRGRILFAGDEITRPGIDVDRVRVESFPDQENRLLILVDYRVRSNNAKRNLVYPFYMKEA